MQRAAATRASPGTRRVGEIAIAGEQQLMESGVGQQVSIQRCVLPASMAPTSMAKPAPKPGRNDPCHCGSGNKYKKCCLAEDEAAERDRLVKAQVRRDQPAVAHRHEGAAADRLHVAELTAAVAARLRMAEEEDAYEDELDAASNAVVQLVAAARLDEAEAAARDLLLRFPDVHDGWDRLGMVHEARGDSRQAADCYRKVIDFIRQHPDRYDAGIGEQFAKLIERLDPPVTS
jgi:tetratricopeptide (TPR) repeat protein